MQGQYQNKRCIKRSPLDLEQVTEKEMEHKYGNGEIFVMHYNCILWKSVKSAHKILLA